MHQRVHRVVPNWSPDSLHGVSETIRVLLRRVPWRILVRRGASADLDLVRLLAEQRDVPVEEVDELPYSSVGLVRVRGANAASHR